MHFSPWMVAVFSIILAALFGILLGLPTLQLRGDYLAIVTLGFGEIIRIFMNNLDRPLNLTNGPKGITAIDPLQVFGITFTKPFDMGFMQIPSLYLVFYLFLTLAVLVTIVCLHLQNSRIGRAWVAIREDEIAAKAMGINTRNMKLLAFAIGASFAGVAGVLFSAFQGFVSPESFTLWESIVVLAMVVLGGIGHIPGVILGAIVLAVFPEVLRGVAEPIQKMVFGHVIVDVEVIRQLIYGLALILIMLYRPGGIWQKRGDQ
jgi:branched-chain amino acid transport system permease protein